MRRIGCFIKIVEFVEYSCVIWRSTQFAKHNFVHNLTCECCLTHTNILPRLNALMVTLWRRILSECSSMSCASDWIWQPHSINNKRTNRHFHWQLFSLLIWRSIDFAEMTPQPQTEALEVIENQLNGGKVGDINWWLWRILFAASASAHDNHHSSGLAEFTYRTGIRFESASNIECDCPKTKTGRHNSSRRRIAAEYSQSMCAVGQWSACLMEMWLSCVFPLAQQRASSGNRGESSANIAYASVVSAVRRKAEICNATTANSRIQSTIDGRNIGIIHFPVPRCKWKGYYHRRRCSPSESKWRVQCTFSDTKRRIEFTFRRRWIVDGCNVRFAGHLAICAEGSSWD